MAQKNKVKELVGRGLNSYHTKALQQMDRIEKKNKEQNHKISILSNELDNDYLTKTEEGSVISLEHSKEGMVYLDSLEGNTMVNYCTDGSKELTLNGDIDLEGTFVTTTEGVDNGLVDIMCEGNTLVNLVKTPKKSITSSYTSVYDMMYAKENTEYTIGFKLTNVVKGDYTGKFNISVENSPNSEMIQVPFENGAYKIKVTTRNVNSKPSLSIAETVKVCFWTVGTNMGESYTVSDVYALEGDYLDKDLICFEGMKSVGELEENKIEILSTDLKVDLNTVKEGISIAYNSGVQTDGTEFEMAGRASINNIYVKENAKITIEGVKPLRIHFYDINKNWLSQQNENVQSFTIPSNCRYIGFAWDATKYNYNDLKVTSSNLNKKEISLNEPLRGLPNGVKDKKVKIGNKWYIERNCAEYDITDVSGNEWAIETNSLGSFLNGNSSKYKHKSNSECICDKLPSTTINSAFVPDFNAITSSLGGENQWRIKITSCETKEDYVEWVSKNPLKVVVEKDIPTYEPLLIIPELECYNDITHISNNSIIPCNMKIQNSGYNAIIKPSTLYTVALDTNKSGTIGMNLGGMKTVTTNNVATITTPAILSDDSLRLFGKGIKGSKVRLLEGDKTNWIPSHFEGMKSSFEDKLQDDGTYKMEILSNNENLFDINEFVKGYSTKDIVGYVENGVRLKSNSWAGHERIGFKVEPYTTYKVTFTIRKENDEVTPNFEIYESNTTTTSYFWTTSVGTHTRTFTTKGNTEVFIRMDTSQLGYSEYSNVSISKISSNFVPQQSNKIQFSSIEPLRKWDRFVLKDNQLMIERGSGTFVLNSKNGYGLSAGGWENKTDVCTFEHYKPTPTAILNNQITFYTDSVPSLTFHQQWSESGSKGREGMSTHQQGGFVLSIKRHKLISQDVNGLDKYLRENPIKVTYKLAEPTYEEIPFELQKIILEGYENGTLFLDTNIPPTSTVTYAGETPIVKSVKLNKTEVSSNTDDINDNIIPYLMDMDYRVVKLQLATEEIEGGVSMARLFGGAYEMLKRDILSKRLTREEYGHRIADYYNAGKLTEEQVRELEDLR